MDRDLIERFGFFICGMAGLVLGKIFDISGLEWLGAILFVAGFFREQFKEAQRRGKFVKLI